MPTVLSRREVQAVIGNLRPPFRLLVQVMYGGEMLFGRLRTGSGAQGFGGWPVAAQVQGPQVVARGLG